MKLHHTIAIDAPADAAWKVLGEEFGQIADWSATLASSSLIGPLDPGATRVCQGRGFGPFPPGEVREELTRFDREARAFAYVAISGLPWFVAEARNAWHIEADGPDRCVVHTVATVELVWWLRPLGTLMPWATRSAMQELSDELRHRVERGLPHPRNEEVAA